MTTNEHLSSLRQNIKHKFDNLPKHTYHECDYEHILILDDNKICNTLHKNTINNYNYAKKVTILETIEECLEFIKNEKVDIIFANTNIVITPDYSYTKLLSENCNHLICLSPMPSMNDDIVLGEHSVYLSKPVKITSLKRILDMLKKK